MKMFLFWVLVTVSSFSQELLKKEVSNFVGVDVFENFYYLKNNTLYKSSLENNYQNLNYGKPDVIDISNPMQVLVFYQNFNTVVFLDNHLNYISEVPVPFGVSLIANAGKDKLWLYNKLQSTLSIYNYYTKKTSNTSLPNVKNTTKLSSDLNSAYILDKNNIWSRYNFLAQKQEAKQVKQQLLSISLRNLYAINQQQLWFQDNMVLKLPTAVSAFEVVNNQCYYLSENAIYRITIAKN
ncbi:hypothetical protein [Ochrovirga pacifica]|uniref:hypothetical protein n=1 Tax=Ochrovirga pacifica TaxID=1042376 RepID=UPI0002559AC6|nr:hypothetical protein [Ochrovirga pacifica]